MAPKQSKWYLFADDFGDPGTKCGSSPYFGYMVLGVAYATLPKLTQARAEFRARRGSFNESKPKNVFSDGFIQAFQLLEPLFGSGEAVLSASFLLKERYTGAWLEPKGEIPRSANMLRNYLMRKCLELMFQYECNYESISAELVVDRVGYNHRQLENAWRYLRGDFNEHGRFHIPNITDVTHADSRYVEGLQIADQLGRIVTHMIKNSGEIQRIDEVFGSAIRVQCILGGRPFKMHPEAGDGL